MSIEITIFYDRSSPFLDSSCSLFLIFFEDFLSSFFEKGKRWILDDWNGEYLIQRDAKVFFFFQ